MSLYLGGKLEAKERERKKASRISSVVLRKNSRALGYRPTVSEVSISTRPTYDNNVMIYYESFSNIDRFERKDN